MQAKITEKGVFLPLWLAGLIASCLLSGAAWAASVKYDMAHKAEDIAMLREDIASLRAEAKDTKIDLTNKINSLQTEIGRLQLTQAKICFALKIEGC